jgi:hypothetical protein
MMCTKPRRRTPGRRASGSAACCPRWHGRRSNPPDTVPSGRRKKPLALLCGRFNPPSGRLPSEGGRLAPWTVHQARWAVQPARWTVALGRRTAHSPGGAFQCSRATAHLPGAAAQFAGATVRLALGEPRLAGGNGPTCEPAVSIPQGRCRSPGTNRPFCGGGSRRATANRPRRREDGRASGGCRARLSRCRTRAPSCLRPSPAG